MIDFDFTTGPAPLPDIGTLKYNGCVFSPLFETKVSGNCVKDNARRTVKFIEYTITADGYVTLPAGATTIGSTMATLYGLLTAQGGQLTYSGRALDIVTFGDVAWGPIPEMLEFQPLGGGRSAKVSWKVTVRLHAPSTGGKSGVGGPGLGGIGGSLGIIQLNYETSVSYDDAGYSSISIKGTLEAPGMSRSLTQKNREVETTVDNYRQFLENRILKGIDLGRFTLTRRNFDISRDKRTMEWDIEAQEKPYMDLPPNCTLARGSYSIRPAKIGAGLATWICTLRATYTVAAGQRRDWAQIAFFSLMFLRMQQTLVAPDSDNPPPPNQLINGKEISKKPLIIDFNVDEGMYQDSRTIGFSATWRLISRLSQILIAGGVWRKVPEGGRDQAKNLWAQSMTLGRFGSIMGAKSWLPNQLDPKLDVIIDIGSTEV